MVIDAEYDSQRLNAVYREIGIKIHDEIRIALLQQSQQRVEGGSGHLREPEL